MTDPMLDPDLEAQILAMAPEDELRTVWLVWHTDYDFAAVLKVCRSQKRAEAFMATLPSEEIYPAEPERGLQEMRTPQTYYIEERTVE